MVQGFVIVASTPADVLRYAAAFFLVVVAIGLVWALIRLARTLSRVDSLVADTNKEMVPLLSRAQVTLDQVNSELGKVDEILGSVVNVTNKLDATSNVVESAVSTPVKKAAAFSAGVTQAVSSFFARHDDQGAAGSPGDERQTERPSWSSTWSASPAAGASPDAAQERESAATASGQSATPAASTTGAAASSATGEAAGASPATDPVSGDRPAGEATTGETGAP